MAKYVLYRLLALIPIVLGVSLLVYSLFWIVPGDVADIMMGEEAYGDPKAFEELRKTWNLDKPFYYQYGMWLWNAIQGDLGKSFVSGHNVSDEFFSRVPLNIELMSVAMFFVIALGIPIGILSSYKQHSLFDHLVRFATTLGYSVPRFWAATMAVLLGSYLKWLPVLEYVPFSENPLANIKCTLIPGFVVGLGTISYVVRMSRSSALDTLRHDYVRTARAKGATEKVVLSVHVLKNSLIPVVTILGFQMGFMIGGFVLVEHVFVLPGVGSMLLLAIQQRDIATVTGGILYLSVAFVLINLIVDIIYCFLDPRIKY